MKIAIGADPLALELKDKIKQHLVKKEYEVIDVSETPMDYITTAHNVAINIQDKQADFGILICNSGMGVSIVANKHKGVYCALCESVWSARKSRLINDANILAFGAAIVGEKMAIDMVDVFLESSLAQNESLERKQTLSNYLVKLQDLENKIYSK